MTASVTRPWSWSSTTGSTVSAQCLMSLGLASQTGFHHQYFSFELSPMWETRRCDVVLKWEWGGASVPPGSFTPRRGSGHVTSASIPPMTGKSPPPEYLTSIGSNSPCLKVLPQVCQDILLTPTRRPDCREASHCPHLDFS